MRENQPNLPPTRDLFPFRTSSARCTLAVSQLPHSRTALEGPTRLAIGERRSAAGGKTASGRRRPSQSQIPVPYCCSSMLVCPCLEDGARSIPGRLTVESAGGRAASGQRRPLPASGDPAPWPLQLQACSLAPLLQQNSIGK